MQQVVLGVTGQAVVAAVIAGAAPRFQSTPDSPAPPARVWSKLTAKVSAPAPPCRRFGRRSDNHRHRRGAACRRQCHHPKYHRRYRPPKYRTGAALPDVEANAANQMVLVCQPWRASPPPPLSVSSPNQAVTTLSPSSPMIRSTLEEPIIRSITARYSSRDRRRQDRWPG